jgi:hypothetical protein
MAEVRMVTASDASAGTERAGGASVMGMLTVLGWIVVACVIASSYVGHSFSPYGSCHNAQGRGIQCLAGRR